MIIPNINPIFDTIQNIITMNGQTITTQNGNEYTFYRTTNDVNGNPRYIVHFLDLGLELYLGQDLSSYGKIIRDNRTKKAGLKVYKGKDFGGGYVFQSYNLQYDAEHFESLGLHRKD